MGRQKPPQGGFLLTIATNYAIIELSNINKHMNKYNQWYANIAANGGPKDPIEIEDKMISSGVPSVANTGIAARMKRLGLEQERQRFAAANAPAAAPGVVAPMAPPPEPGSFGADVMERRAADPFAPRTNMLPGAAAAPVATVNNLSAPQQAIADLNRRIATNMALGTEQGYKNAEMLQKQVDALGKRYTVGGTLMGPEGNVVGTAPETSPDLVRQYNFAKTPAGGNYPGTYQEFRISQAQARANRINNTVKLPAVEGEYSKKFAGQTADEDIKMLGAARNAPKVAVTANRVMELLANPDIFVGPAAAVKLNVARALNVLGADETESMRNTEKLIAAAGQGTLDAIKDAGLGTGQGFTAKDLEFLTNVAGGKIDFTAENLRTMARLQHRAAETSVKKFITRRGNMPESATKGTGIDKETYELPTRIGGPTPEAIAYLKANPNTKAAFDKRYGDGEAEHTLRMGK
jgi:hypothetical protein